MAEHKITHRSTRRRFVFWLGLGLFSLGERVHAKGLDTLAAAAMRATERHAQEQESRPKVDPYAGKPVHWTPGENNSWRWYEREHLLEEKWEVTGISVPIHKETGERYAGRGYLDESLVPESLRRAVEEPWRDSAEQGVAGDSEASEESLSHIEHDHGKPSTTRRARHGRPPSRWLRSLYADELHVWLKTIEVPEAGVEGMTYRMHLTRDHSFDPKRIDGLDEPDLAKLHAAAHYGY